MATALRAATGYHDTGANVAKTVLTTTAPARLRRLSVRNTSSANTAKVTLLINTYTYCVFQVPPLDGYSVTVRGYVGGSTSVQLTTDQSANTVGYALSYVDDVNTPSGGIALTGARGYYAPGAPSTVTAIWTPPATGNHRLTEVALANVSSTATYRFTLWQGTSGYPFFSASLAPGEAYPFDFDDVFVTNTALALSVDAPDNVTQWHYTATTDANNAAGV